MAIAGHKFIGWSAVALGQAQGGVLQKNSLLEGRAVPRARANLGVWLETKALQS
jgi:hypothetical protein